MQFEFTGYEGQKITLDNLEVIQIGKHIFRQFSPTDSLLIHFFLSYKFPTGISVAEISRLAQRSLGSVRLSLRHLQALNVVELNRSKNLIFPQFKPVNTWAFDYFGWVREYLASEGIDFDSLKNPQLLNLIDYDEWKSFESKAITPN